MGATYTFTADTGNYASVAAQTKYNNTNAPTIAFKARVKGDFWTNLASYQGRRLFVFPSRDGFQMAAYQSDPGVYKIEAYSGNQGYIGLDLSGFTPDAAQFYVLHGQYAATGNGGIYVAVADASGTLITASSSTASGDLGGTTGELSIGPTNTAKAFTLDGVAFYNAPLSGATRFTQPTTGDASILGLYKFDEGTGTSVADATGGTSLTIAGSGTWNPNDGAWDGAASVPLRVWMF